METTKRIVWIDYLKVVGMFFIVYGHIFPRLYISHMLSAFFVPVFFVASGYLCQSSYSFPKLIRRLLTTIILYFIICTANFIIHKYLMDENYSWLYFIEAVFIGDTNLIGTMWFVYTLIILRIIHNYIIKIKYLPIIISLICFLLLIIMGEAIKKPNAFLATIISLPFFEIGFYLKKLFNNQIEKHISFIKKHTFIFLTISFIIFVIVWFLARIHGYVNFFKVDYGNNFFLFIFNALAGIYSTFVLSIVIMSLLPKSSRFFSIMSYGNIFTLGFQMYFVVWTQTFIGNYLPPHFRYIIPSEIFAALLIMLFFYPICHLFFITINHNYIYINR